MASINLYSCLSTSNISSCLVIWMPHMHCLLPPHEPELLPLFLFSRDSASVAFSSRRRMRTSNLKGREGADDGKVEKREKWNPFKTEERTERRDRRRGSRIQVHASSSYAAEKCEETPASLHPLCFSDCVLCCVDAGFTLRVCAGTRIYS